MMQRNRLTCGTVFSTIAAASLLATGSAAHAAQLYSNGSLVTSVGNGPGGGNVSMTATDFSTAGFSGQSGQRLADDFVVTGNGWSVQSVTVSGYVQGAYTLPPATPLTGLTLSLWRGAPEAGGSSLIATSSTVLSNTFSGTWRVPAGQPTSTLRPVFDITAGFNDVVLSAGTYWIDYSLFSGSIAFSPLVMNGLSANPSTKVGNAMRRLDPGPDGFWVTLFGGTGPQQLDFPFSVTGTVVPEPASISLLLAGSVGMMKRRRK